MPVTHPEEKLSREFLSSTCPLFLPSPSYEHKTNQAGETSHPEFQQNRLGAACEWIVLELRHNFAMGLFHRSLIFAYIGYISYIFVYFAI